MAEAPMLAAVANLRHQEHLRPEVTAGKPNQRDKSRYTSRSARCFTVDFNGFLFGRRAQDLEIGIYPSQIHFETPEEIGQPCNSWGRPWRSLKSRGVLWRNSLPVPRREAWFVSNH